MAKPKSTVWLAVLPALALGGAWWWQQQPRPGRVRLGGRPQRPVPPAAPVRSAWRSPPSSRRAWTTPGRGPLNSRQAVTLKPETAGRVARIAFRTPGRQRGQLVQLDDACARQ